MDEDEREAEKVLCLMEGSKGKPKSMSREQIKYPIVEALKKAEQRGREEVMSKIEKWGDIAVGKRQYRKGLLRGAERVDSWMDDVIGADEFYDSMKRLAESLRKEAGEV